MECIEPHVAQARPFKLQERKHDHQKQCVPSSRQNPQGFSDSLSPRLEVKKRLCLIPYAVKQKEKTGMSREEETGLLMNLRTFLE